MVNGGRRRRLASGDVQTVYAAHGPELFRFALRSLGDHQLAEEIVQETFVRAWRFSERYDAQKASLRTWLFSIARNAVIDAHRSRRTRERAADALARQPAEDGSDPIDDTLQAMHVEEALRRLSTEHRHAIVEVYYRARPYADVAHELGVPVGTVRSRVFYGLKALRVVLEEMGWSS